MKYFERLNLILDRVYDRKDELNLSFKGLAQASKLSMPTIYRLNNRSTRYPRFQTVLLLANAVGLSIDVSYQEKPKLKIHKGNGKRKVG